MDNRFFKWLVKDKVLHSLIKGDGNDNDDCEEEEDALLDEVSQLVS